MRARFAPTRCAPRPERWSRGLSAVHAPSADSRAAAPLRSAATCASRVTAAGDGRRRLVVPRRARCSSPRARWAIARSRTAACRLSGAGYPVDRVRENPRICFTASADGGPPARARGQHALEPQREQRSVNALWRCYTVTVRNRRRIRTPGCRPTSTRRFGGCLGCHGSHDETEQHSAGRRAFLHVNGTLESSGDPGRNPLTGLTLGGDHTGQFTLNGDVAACVLFRGVLPDDARRVLEVHLRRLAAQAAPRPTTAGRGCSLSRLWCLCGVGARAPSSWEVAHPTATSALGNAR